MTSKKWDLGACLRWTTEHFRNNGIGEFETEAKLIFSQVLQIKRLELDLFNDKIIPEEKLALIRSMINERLTKKPLAYILGDQEFYGLLFKVDESVLIPRPETELLVQSVLNFAKENASKSAIDIGTGSGAIAVSLAKFSGLKQIFAVDISLEALKTCQRNCDNNGVSEKITLFQSDIFSAFSSEYFTFDIIVSNPPYISSQEMNELEPELGFEPQNALYGGVDGMDIYNKLALQSKNYLAKNGRLFLEMSATRSKSIQNLFSKNGYKILNIIKDYSGHDRVLELTI